jgi:hypothetical protein
MELFLLIALMLGLIFVTVGSKGVVDHFKSGRWVSTQATVLSAGVEEHKSSDGSLPTFETWLIYEYTYKVKIIRSPKSYLSHSSYFDGADAKKFLDDYSSGTQLTVWISDKFPHKSTPERNAWIAKAIFGVFGVVLICFAFYQLSHSK